MQGRGEDANVKKSFAEKRHRASESGGAFADKKAGALALVWDGQWLVVRLLSFAMNSEPTATKHAIGSVGMVGEQRARFSGNNFSASSLFLPKGAECRSFEDGRGVRGVITFDRVAISRRDVFTVGRWVWAVRTCAPAGAARSRLPGDLSDETAYELILIGEIA